MCEKKTRIDECYYCGQKCDITDLFCTEECKTSYMERFADELESDGRVEEQMI